MRYAEASYSGEGALKRQPPIANSVLGMILFIMTELMFFAALVSAFLIIKSSVEAWPPEGQPRLPVFVTAINSVFLLSSAVTLFLANRSFRQDAYGDPTLKLLKATLYLGILFVAIQGFEWARLISYGLTMTSSQYGAFFYLIIGTHALHAIGAIIGLVWLYRLMKERRLKQQTFSAGQIFWYFVVGLWPILYVLVYLT